MDISGAQPCMFCAAQMLGEQPKMELLCGHFFHTECLVLHWYNEEMSCPSCHMNVFNDHVRTAAIARDQVSRVEKEEKFAQEYAEDKALRDDIKIIKKQVTITRRARGAFMKFGNQKRREWKQETKPLLDLLLVKQKEMIRTVKSSPQLMKWTTERSRLRRYVNVFERKHTKYRFRSLQEYRFLKLPSHWDYRYLTDTFYRSKPRWWFRIRQ